MGFLDFLKEKKKENLDAPETTLQHREIIMRKSFLRKLYIEWYNSFLNIIPDLPKGLIVEIGSGGGFLKELNYDVITSDVLEISHCDKVFSAEDMPFENNSVSAIFMIDVLHHIPNNENFFKEAERVLIKGGAIFMIEPANTFFSRIIFKNLHHEPFNPESPDWSFPTTGPLSGANGALPWIIFRRDLDKFHTMFPSLKLNLFKHHTPYRYLITGGLSFKSIVPGWSFGIVSLFEKILTPIYPAIAMFQTIKVIKQ